MAVIEMEVPKRLAVGEQFVGTPCGAGCGHKPTGTVVGYAMGCEIIDWHDAPDCGCGCHDAWRIIHGVYPAPSSPKEAD